MSEEVTVRKPEEVIQIYSDGWAAMEWLAQHSKANTCRECGRYRHAVDNGRHPRDVIRMRCRLAQAQHRKYMAVKHLRQEMDDAMECFLGDNRTPCYGPVEWVLARRRKVSHRVGHERPQGDLIDYQIGCRRHAEKAETRAIISGDVATVTVEKLNSLTTEEARRMA